MFKNNTFPFLYHTVLTHLVPRIRIIFNEMEDFLQLWVSGLEGYSQDSNQSDLIGHVVTPV